MIYCPWCEETNCTETIITKQFDYGAPVETSLSVDVPQMECPDCTFIWTDWRADEKVDATVREYLKTKAS